MVSTPATLLNPGVTLEDAFRQVQGSSQGLSNAEAARRLQKFGSNEPVAKRQRPFFLRFLALFTNPILIILFTASAVAAALGQKIEASIIITIVLLSSLIDFIQSYRAEVSVERLKNQVSIRASVLREGQWTEAPARDIVPGDVVKLMAGDLSPADCILLEARDLHAQ